MRLSRARFQLWLRSIHDHLSTLPSKGTTFVLKKGPPSISRPASRPVSNRADKPVGRSDSRAGPRAA
jgi:hypothetical protein